MFFRGKIERCAFVISLSGEVKRKGQRKELNGGDTVVKQISPESASQPPGSSGDRRALSRCTALNNGARPSYLQSPYCLPCPNKLELIL